MTPAFKKSKEIETSVEEDDGSFMGGRDQEASISRGISCLHPIWCVVGDTLRLLRSCFQDRQDGGAERVLNGGKPRRFR